MQNNKKKILLIVTVLLLLVIASIALYAQATNTRDTSNQERTASTENTSSAPSITSPGSIQATYSEPITDETSLESFLSERDDRAIIHTATVDWSSQNLIAVEFYMPNGNNFDSITFRGEGSPAEIIAIAPPVGCSFSAVQVQHVALMTISKDTLAPTVSTADYVVEDSQIECPFE